MIHSVYDIFVCFYFFQTKRDSIKLDISSTLLPNIKGWSFITLLANQYLISGADNNNLYSGSLFNRFGGTDKQFY